jgi:ethanolamine ammonia-lyase large subunit
MPTHDEALRALERFSADAAIDPLDNEAVETLRSYIEQAKVTADRLAFLEDSITTDIDAAIAARSAKTGETR